MSSVFFSAVFAILIVFLNSNLRFFTSEKYQSPLICVSSLASHFSVGLNSQIVDAFWIRFLQELDAYNQMAIAEPHLCPDKTSSWHFHIMNVATDLDGKFYELMVHAPLLVAITIGDSKGASILFDKSVANFPNDWKILYRASYQAQIEERNNKKAAELLYRAGKNGAPRWVMSLAGGLYNEAGSRRMAEQIYSELLADEKDVSVAKRLKQKLESKLKNFYEQPPPAPEEKRE
tara:strand:- start:84138 stop:84836 length:699 start_codon:yes stop_codon:yes gene_type:complete